MQKRKISKSISQKSGCDLVVTEKGNSSPKEQQEFKLRVKKETNMYMIQKKKNSGKKVMDNNI